VIEDSQIWLIIGVTSAVVAVLTIIGVIANAYITSRRLATVLSDVEEIIHADLRTLENKLEAALARIRAAESRIGRE
jgi:hypothetical protein